MIDASLEKYANMKGSDFERVLQDLPNCESKIYDLKYYQDEGLHTLEAFAEGKFTIAGKLEVERKYIKSGDSLKEKSVGHVDNFTYYTKVTNLEA